LGYDVAKLTLKTIESLEPAPAVKEHADGHIAGLYFCLQPSGKASWTVRYRHGGKSRKLTIGPYPAIGLGVARERASVALGEVAQGLDPAAEKKAAKAAARAPPDHDLVEIVVESFIKRHVKSNLRPSWARETERMLNKEIVGAWKGKRLSAIGKADINGLLDGIIDRGAPILANRTLAALRRMCSWAIERGLIDASPCAGIRAPAPEQSRDRVLDDPELKAVWGAAEGLGVPFGPLVRLLLLTGQRRAEVAEMRWSEIDFETRAWTLPKERAKNGVAHTVPLLPQAVEILETLPRIAGEDDLVFTSNGKTPVSGFSKAKARIDAVLPDLPHWTFHDLRRTFASGCAKLGVNLPVIEKLLNHVSGSFAGIVGVYQRHSFADEKRAAMQVWARHVEELVSGEAGNVVEMKRGARE
jgi:integrase